ncbi:MAG: hypothetical protein IPQ01_18540 [Zoogloea sp.]|jgi:hypothetical protein|nr:hypothetical protein [Zoogloea sp.]
MKLTQLPLGARFEYDGEIFTKTGPMTAASEKHGQRMIPRYAVLKPADGFTPPAQPEAARTLDEAAVLAAFERFFGTALRLSDDFSKAELEAARQKFLAALKD